jgi:hypothetical protein
VNLLVAMLPILALIQAVLALWLLVKAYQLSTGWFLFLFPLYLGAGVLFTESLGPVLGGLIVMGGTLLFVVSYWQDVKTPFVLLMATGALSTLILVQAGRTLREQARQQAQTQEAR